MGTNYYLRYNYCPCCGRYERSHIGKSSAGWKFQFRLYKQYDVDFEHPSSVDGWFETLYIYDSSPFYGCGIYDEYGKNITFKDFWDLVKSKQGGRAGINSVDMNGYSYVKHWFS